LKNLMQTELELNLYLQHGPLNAVSSRSQSNIQFKFQFSIVVRAIFNLPCKCPLHDSAFLFKRKGRKFNGMLFHSTEG